MADLNPLDALENIPGVKQLEEAATALAGITHAVSTVAEHLNIAGAMPALTHLLTHVGKSGHIIESLADLGWKDLSKYGTGTLFKEYLRLGLGLDPDKINSEARKAVETIDTMLTFSTLFPLSITAVDSVLHFFLGQRAPHLAESFLGRLAEEMGLTWAMGMTIDRSFETAVGNKLEEAILHQKRPIDPEIQVLRLMLRQHLVDEDTLIDRAAHMGYSDKWAHKFAKLADAQLPVGDLQQLYLHELIEPHEIDAHLEELGFNKEDRGKLKTLYITKSQTMAGAAMRSVARDAFLRGLMGEDGYRSTLGRINWPSRETEMDVEAIHLEQTLGRLTTPLSAIKGQYQHHELEPQQARTTLRQMLYTDEAIDNLFKLWDEPKTPHPMAASKVLSYFASGVLTNKQDVVNRLIATGLRPDDAQFLVDHPDAVSKRKHLLTPALIVAAYMDDTIDQDTLYKRLQDIGQEGDILTYTFENALYRKSRQKPKGHGSLHLDKAEIIAAYKVGIYDPQTALNDLVLLGYTDTDALTLLEIAGKGSNPFAAVHAPIFANLEEAIAFLETHGFVIIGPPDPRIGAAEALLAQYGYTAYKAGAGIANFPQGIPGANNPSYQVPSNLGPFPGTSPP